MAINTPYSFTNPRANLRGKTGRQLKEIVKELRKEIQALKFAHKQHFKTRTELRGELRVVKKTKIDPEELDELREDKNKTITNLRVSRKHFKESAENLRIVVEGLEEKLKQKDREIANLEKMIVKLGEKVKLFKSQAHRKRRVKVKSVKRPLTAYAKRLEGMVERGVNEKHYNVYINSMKLVKFAELNNMSVELLTILLQLEAEQSCKVIDLKTGTRTILNTGVRKELINYQTANKTKNYFLTNKGSELVVKLRNYISYSHTLRNGTNSK